MGKIKYLLLLVTNTVIVSAVYYYLLNTLHFFPAMAIFQILAILAVCGYLLFVFYIRNEIGKAAAQHREIPKEITDKRRKRLKMYMVCTFPFLFTVLIDYIYLIIFVDNPIFESIIKSIK